MKKKFLFLITVIVWGHITIFSNCWSSDSNGDAINDEFLTRVFKVRCSAPILPDDEVAKLDDSELDYFEDVKLYDREELLRDISNGKLCYALRNNRAVKDLLKMLELKIPIEKEALASMKLVKSNKGLQEKAVCFERNKIKDLQDFDEKVRTFVMVADLSIDAYESIKIDSEPINYGSKPTDAFFKPLKQKTLKLGLPSLLQEIAIHSIDGLKKEGIKIPSDLDLFSIGRIKSFENVYDMLAVIFAATPNPPYRYPKDFNKSMEKVLKLRLGRNFFAGTKPIFVTSFLTRSGMDAIHKSISVCVPEGSKIDSISLGNDIITKRELGQDKDYIYYESYPLGVFDTKKSKATSNIIMMGLPSTAEFAVDQSPNGKFGKAIQHVKKIIDNCKTKHHVTVIFDQTIELALQNDPLWKFLNEFKEEIADGKLNVIIVKR